MAKATSNPSLPLSVGGLGSGPSSNTMFWLPKGLHPKQTSVCSAALQTDRQRWTRDVKARDRDETEAFVGHETLARR